MTLARKLPKLAAASKPGGWLEVDLDVTVLGDECVVFVTDEIGSTAYIVYDRRQVRQVLEEAAESAADPDVEATLEQIATTDLPEDGGSPALRFDASVAEVFEGLVERAKRALARGGSLEQPPQGSVCTVLGPEDSNDCILFGFCLPSGEHRILVIESQIAWSRAAEQELGWLDPRQLARYTAMFEAFLPAGEEEDDGRYIAVNGSTSRVLNTGCYWMDTWGPEELDGAPEA